MYGLRPCDNYNLTILFVGIMLFETPKVDPLFLTHDLWKQPLVFAPIKMRTSIYHFHILLLSKIMQLLRSSVTTLAFSSLQLNLPIVISDTLFTLR
jgi:hypothetical protein